MEDLHLNVRLAHHVHLDLAAHELRRAHTNTKPRTQTHNTMHTNTQCTIHNNTQTQNTQCTPTHNPQQHKHTTHNTNTAVTPHLGSEHVVYPPVLCVERVLPEAVPRRHVREDLYEGRPGALMLALVHERQRSELQLSEAQAPEG